MMPAAFAPFVERAPFCVRTRVTLEALFRPQRLDEPFRDTAQRQDHKELLFSQLVELMLSAVLRVAPTAHAADRKRADVVPVSDRAVYDKLRGMELGVSAAPVADAAAQVAPVIRALKARPPAWLPGYRARVLDGNHLSATRRRLRELRPTWAAALPGKVRAVYDPQDDLVTQVFLTPDGHAQGRAPLGEVLPAARARDLWIAGRNFCALQFLFGIAAARAAFVLRQHGTLVGRPLGRRRRRGRAAAGTVYEQRSELPWGGHQRVVRRITAVLDGPTRDGDTEIHVLPNPPQRGTAARAAELYRRRWAIEGRFYEVAQARDGEPNALGYPEAALFAFCLALVAANAVALLKASLRAAHGTAAAELSAYHLTPAVRQTYVGMMVALPPPCWAAFAALSAGPRAEVLGGLARQLRPGRYRKGRRGPKKPPTPKGRYKNGGHVSTHQLIQQRLK